MCVENKNVSGEKTTYSKSLQKSNWSLNPGGKIARSRPFVSYSCDLVQLCFCVLTLTQQATTVTNNVSCYVDGNIHTSERSGIPSRVLLQSLHRTLISLKRKLRVREGKCLAWSKTVVDLEFRLKNTGCRACLGFLFVFVLYFGQSGS